VLSDTLWITVAGLINRAKGILFIPLIVGSIGLEGYGAFIQIFITAKLVSTLSSLELGMGFERLAAALSPEDERGLARHVGSVVWPALLQALGGALLLFGLAPLFSRLFLDGSHVDALRVSAGVVLSNTLQSAGHNLLAARRRFAHQALLDLFYELGPYVAFVIATLLSQDLLVGIAAYATLDALAAVTMFLLARRGLPWERPSWALYRTYLRYSAPLALSNIEGGLLDKADRYFIGAMMGLEAVGLYNMVYRCTELVGYLSLPLRSQMVVYLSHAWDRGALEESRALIRGTVLTFLSLTSGLLISLALYADQLLPLLAGAQVSLPHLELAVLAIGGGTLANACRRFVFVYIRLRQTTHDEFLYQFVGLALNVVGNLLLIPRLGVLGAAIATLVSYVAMIPLSSRKYALGFDLAFFGHLASVAALCGLVVPLRYLVPSGGIGWILVGMVGLYGVYLALLLVLKRRLWLGLRRQWLAWQ